MKVAYVNEMRDMDHRAITEYGIPDQILMENAGQAVYYTVLNEFGVLNKKFVVFCGTGNNGGDGLVTARKLHSTGGSVIVFIIGNRSSMKDTAKQNLDIALKANIPIIDLKNPDSAKEAVRDSDAIIDAIFGTGLDRNVGGIHHDVINMINEAQKTVFSVDIPSGINGNTGELMGAAIAATFTITFGLPKTGNLLYPGFARGGKLFVTHISFPPDLYNASQIQIATNDPCPIPPRNQDTHKGNFGKALFIAGSAAYRGAPYFAALSFLKAGGGLSYLATPANGMALFGNKGSEIVFLPQESNAEGSLGLSSKQKLLAFSEKVDIVVIGPGLSLNEETQSLVRELCAEIKKPLLIDGDGISAVANNLEILKKRKFPTILTPHVGEMARLTKLDIDEIIKNRISILKNTAETLNSIIVLKGAHSLIGCPDKNIFINLSGNAGMASAGSGDILTGIIAAMYGTGFPLNEAVRTAVFIHGLAGDLAAKDKGEDGMIASDIMEQLPASIKNYRENRASIVANHYGNIFLV